MNEDQNSPTPAADGGTPAAGTATAPAAPAAEAAPAPAPAASGDAATPAAAASSAPAADGTTAPATDGSTAPAAAGADGTTAGDATGDAASPEAADGQAADGTDATAGAPAEGADAAPPTPAPVAPPAAPQLTATVGTASEAPPSIDAMHVLTEASGPVLSIIVLMVVMGLGCVYVAIERLWALGKARSQSRALAQEAAGALAVDGGAAALKIAQKPEYKDSYLGHLLVRGLTEFTERPDRHGIEATERALQRAALDEDPILKKGFGVLATTGATCPFVGLVGTIFGIIAAFDAMQGEGGANVMALVGPIAEALYATAIGIGVAIVGVWLFNYFNHRVDQIKKDMNTSTLELLDWCEKQILPPIDNSAK